MADQKLTALTATTTLGDTDLLYVVDGVGGTPAPKKITVANLRASTGGLAEEDIDTLAELNAIVTDATLDDSSDTRTPASHGNEAHSTAYAPAVSSGARVYQTAGQSIANNAWVTLQFDAEAEDTDSYHDNVTNNERLTAPSTGVYLVQANARIPGNTGDRAVRIRLNGTTVRFNLVQAGSNYEGGAIAVIRLRMTAGQYVDAQALHTQGSATAANSGAAETSFEISRLGD